MDLVALCGSKFVIEHDATVEAYPALKKDPWMVEVPTSKGGRLYPYSATELAFESPRRGVQKHLLTNIPGARKWRESDEGFDTILPASEWASIVKIVKPIRRRRFSEDQKANLKAAGSSTRRSGGRTPRKRAS